MKLFIVGILLGTITYFSWIGYYWLYLPKRIKHWFEQSMSRLFMLDLALTILSMIIFSGVSSSLTALIAASTLGLLGTLTTIMLRFKYIIKQRISQK